jgi:hypothetical protein
MIDERITERVEHCVNNCLRSTGMFDLAERVKQLGLKVVVPTREVDTLLVGEVISERGTPTCRVHRKWRGHRPRSLPSPNTI